mgnify:CR=1 FL=1
MKPTAYPQYKDSSIKWLGRIPAHWEVVPFKTLLARNDSGVWGDDPDGESDTLVLRSTEQNVDGSWSIDDPAWRKLSAREKSEALLRKTDLVVTKSSGSQLHIGKTSYVDEDVASRRACFSNFMQRLRLKPGNVPRLFWHLMNSPVCRQQFVFLSSTTTGLGNLNGGIIGAVTVPAPPSGEQQAIADVLDQETAKIDALVEKKKRLIELLQEKRTALITHAVTKGLPAAPARAHLADGEAAQAGLDPKVPMKDSLSACGNAQAGGTCLRQAKRGKQVEWLGHLPARGAQAGIPEHWDVPPLYARYEVNLGKMLDSKRITGEHLLPYLRNVDVQWDFVAVDDLPEMDVFPYEHERYTLRAGDLLVCEGGEVGRTAVWRGELPVCAYQKAVHRLRPRSKADHPRFLFYVMRAAASMGIFLARGNPNTIPHLTGEQLRKYRFAFPPEREQRKIIDHLDCETAKIDALIAKIGEAIERLKEYRTALISAAVTGKIDVRDESRATS